MSVDDEEGQLIVRARTDQAAMQTLCLRYYDQLLRVVVRRLPIWMERHVSAEDVLQDIFARVIQHFDSLQPIGGHSFLAWSSRIAQNHISNLVGFYQAQKRHGVVADVSLDAASSHTAVALLHKFYKGQKTTSEIVAQKEKVEELRRCIDKLKEPLASALQLRYVNGHSTKSTARLMGRTERAVEQLCFRALRELRRQFPKSAP